MKLLLDANHREHLRKIGVPVVPEMQVGFDDYSQAMNAWRRTLPHADGQTLHMKALGHIAHQQHHARLRSAAAERVRKVEEHHLGHARLLRWLVALFIVILLALVWTAQAHAQFSKVTYIQFQQGGSSVAGGFFSYPFNFNCSTNVTCTASNGTLTITAAGGVGGAPPWDTITNPATGNLALTQFANGNDFFTVTRKTDTAPTGSWLWLKNAAGGTLCKIDITGTMSGCAVPTTLLTGTVTNAQLASSYSGVGACASHQWVSTLNANAAPTCTQPGWDELTNPKAGGLSLTQFANGNDFFIVTRNTDTAPTGSWLWLKNAAGGTLCKIDITGTMSGCAVPTTLLTGTVTNAQLASSYSGVGACGANSWASTLNANAPPTCTQPAFSSLSGTATSAQVAATAGWKSDSNSSSTAGPVLTGANNCQISGFWTPPGGITFSKVGVRVVATDAVNNYDWGILNSSGTKVCDVGVRTLGASGNNLQSCSQGTVTLPGGKAYFAFTGTAVTATLAVTGSGSGITFLSASSVTACATTGTLNSLTPPADAATTTGSMFAFVLD